MTNGSQSHSGHEPPRHPGKTNDLDPRLVEKMDKMRQELKECQSLKEEIKGQQQRASQQAPSQCQPDQAQQRRLNNAVNGIEEICQKLESVKRQYIIARNLALGKQAWWIVPRLRVVRDLKDSLGTTCMRLTRCITTKPETHITVWEGYCELK